jgi:hypothetical protein
VLQVIVIAKQAKERSVTGEAGWSDRRAGVLVRREVRHRLEMVDFRAETVEGQQ